MIYDTVRASVPMRYYVIQKESALESERVPVGGLKTFEYSKAGECICSPAKFIMNNTASFFLSRRSTYGWEGPARRLATLTPNS